MAHVTSAPTNQAGLVVEWNGTAPDTLARRALKAQHSAENAVLPYGGFCE